MKKLSTIALYVCLAFVAVKPVPAAADVENNFTFTTEAQMKAAVVQNATKLRASYYIIIRARKVGLEEQTALAYHALIKPSVYDHRLLATFAFAHYTATDSWHSLGAAGRRPRSSRYPLLLKLESEAWMAREDSLKRLSNTPEVLVMSGIAHSTRSENGLKPVDLFRKAVKLAPEWGHAHYWLAREVIDNAVVQKDPVKRKALAEEGIQELTKAERLDPSTHRKCLSGKAYGYNALKEYGTALRYMDAYLAENTSAEEKLRMRNFRNFMAEKAGEPQI